MLPLDDRERQLEDEVVGEVTTRHLATLRAMLAGCGSHPIRVTAGEEGEQYARHREAIEFAIKHLGTANVSGVATAQVRAVVARAWYSSDHAMLIHFCDVLRSGMASGEGDTCILMLRDFLIGNSRVGRGESARRLRYAKMQWALSAFLRGQSPKRLCGAPGELFPLPEQVSKTAAA